MGSTPTLGKRTRMHTDLEESDEESAALRKIKRIYPVWKARRDHREDLRRSALGSQSGTQQIRRVPAMENLRQREQNDASTFRQEVQEMDPDNLSEGGKLLPKSL